MNKKAEGLRAATIDIDPNASYWSLFNPVSTLSRKGVDRIPNFVATMFPESPRTAFLVSKTGALMLLAGALAGGSRLLTGSTHLSPDVERDDPSRKLKSQLSTTFAVPLDSAKGNKKKKTEDKTIEKTAASTAYKEPGWSEITKNTVDFALPAAAMLLAGSVTWRGADDILNASRNRALTKSVADKSNTVRTLIKTRARLARGTATPEEIEKALQMAGASEGYQKEASALSCGGVPKTAAFEWLKEKLTRLRLTQEELDKIRAEDKPHAGFWSNFGRFMVTSGGLLTAGLLLASAVGSYKYFSATDPNNIRHKALKNGLKAYAREKTSITPITTAPTDADEYFNEIDAPAAAADDIRKLPEQQPTRKPIDVTMI